MKKHLLKKRLQGAFYVGATALALMTPAIAAANTGVGGIFKRIGELGASGTVMITAIAYLIAAVLAVFGLMNIKALGQPQQQPGKAAAVATSLIAAFFLAYLPTTFKTGAETLWGGTGVTANQAEGTKTLTGK